MENSFFEIASVRPSVRASVQEPIVLASVDFASPKMMGSKKRHIPFRTPFLTSNRSISFLKKGSMRRTGYLLSLCFLLRNSQKSYFLFCHPTGANSYKKSAASCRSVFFGEILNGQHSRNRLRRTKAEGASVFSHRFFVGFHSWRGVSKNRFFKSRPSVRPGAHSPRIGRFCLTKSDGFPEETHSILETVFALKSVDLFS